MDYSVSAAVQLFSLLSQLLDDICTNLLCLCSDALASFNTLAGVVQSLCALE